MIEKMMDRFDGKYAHVALIIISMLGTHAVFTLSLLPTIVGSVFLGLLGGLALWGYIRIHINPITETETLVKKEIVPYDEWPDTCHICNKEITDDMNTRGQLVVHKGESDTETKAAPLCDTCTWTHSTLAEYHEELVSPLDCSDEPVDL